MSFSEKHHSLVKTTIASFGATFWKAWTTFYFTIGHTGCHLEQTRHRKPQQQRLNFLGGESEKYSQHKLLYQRNKNRNSLLAIFKVGAKDMIRTLVLHVLGHFSTRFWATLWASYRANIEVK